MVERMETLAIPGDRLLVFGGVYGNIHALDALLDEARRLDIKSEQMICTGDLVAYCAAPQAVVDRIRTLGITTIQGNCEEALASDSDDCGCGFEDGSACSLLSAQWYYYCQTHLTPEARDWMGQLPSHGSLTLGDHSMLVVHGSPSSVNAFIFPSISEDDLSGHFVGARHDIILSGHSGIPFHRQAGSRHWINSGALGMPANNGTARVWYALLETRGNGSLSVRICPLDYDHKAAARLMRNSGLNNGYADCLESGYWPSLDVLPDRERQKTGHPLNY